MLNTNEQVEYNLMKIKYDNQKKTLLPLIVGVCTTGAFLIGVWRLPSRKSTAVYTLTGLGSGIGIAYGCWRYWAYQYYEKLNYYFGIIVQHRYTQNPRKTTKEDLFLS